MWAVTALNNDFSTFANVAKLKRDIPVETDYFCLDDLTPTQGSLGFIIQQEHNTLREAY